MLNRLLPHYQPAVIAEFRSYTVRELDLTTEADNGEIFAAYFHATPTIVFPRMHRELSSASVLTMEFLDGFKPGAPATFDLSEPEGRAGGQPRRPGDFADAVPVRFFTPICTPAICWFYRADRCGSALSIWAWSGGLKTKPGGGCCTTTMRWSAAMSKRRRNISARDCPDRARRQPEEFRRAVVELSRRFLLRAQRGDFSIARLILESMQLQRALPWMYFRAELVLMVKALVTFEGADGRSRSGCGRRCRDPLHRSSAPSSKSSG